MCITSLAIRLTLWRLGWELWMSRFMNNRFPEEAESCSIYSRMSRGLFLFFFIGFVWFFISPSGKAHREIHDFHAVSRVLHLASSGLGRCSLAGGFGWDTVWWEKNVAGFFTQQGGHGPAVVPLAGSSRHSRGGGVFHHARLSFRRWSPNELSTSLLFLSVQQRTAYFPF